VKIIQDHNCEASAAEFKSTTLRPYHYVGSGLKNVCLVGIKYWVCSICGKQSADIPSLGRLLTSIARTLVEKNSPLIGEQVRFLRKRLGKRSKEFAALIGVTPERYSGIEGSENLPLSEGRDKLVRFVYRLFTRDRKLKEALSDQRQIEEWLMAIHGRDTSEQIVGTWVGGRKWHVEATPQALCA
jgi:transcriptional regulator with XRE-family HTH domain